MPLVTGDLGLALGSAARESGWTPAASSSRLVLAEGHGSSFGVDASSFGHRRELLFLERLRMGPDGVAQTISRMGDLVAGAVVDPHLVCRRAVEQIVQWTPGGDRRAECAAIWPWVRARVRYTRDPAFLEYLQDPRALLWLIDRRWRAFGDCDDHAMLTSALCWSIRIPNVFVLVAQGGESDFAHVYCAAELPRPGVDPVEAAKKRARWLAGDDSADSGLLCLDTAAPDAAFGRHPGGAWRRVVPSIS